MSAVADSVVNVDAQAEGVHVPSPRQWDGRRLSAGYIADYKPFNFVDGEGVRCSVYVAGCPFRCPGCYNVAAQSFRYGKLYSADLENQILEDLAQPYVAGLSLVGGEPMLNTPVLNPLVARVRAEFGQTKTVWCWTGYTWEQLQHETDDKQTLLQGVDVLVDGPFIQRLFDSSLAFRGSSNQRIIDVAASRQAGEVVFYRHYR
ncbi:anaerobic ribonucleoside-triphosphate reductase activating protein [Gleimia hominis]|uniref:Anaerobic ribonucleoside-triphosphate reductase-activating protein n=1 Tax=Gleimia hominis TaxID=595468 RepID=A0ABU3IBQ0_9ACTO|nr:anaerobic ribonucleoside-triphosphate reductase activating protein [Gleimia hominis]MDT3767803.1 anaerobic ribonucleoside-triphosphate reductase activating protein [Gleimia hominis]